MTNKFHVNLESGASGPCKAHKKPCPLGGSEVHFNSLQEAQKAYENHMNSSILTSKQKKKSKTFKTSIAIGGVLISTLSVTGCDSQTLNQIEKNINSNLPSVSATSGTGGTYSLVQYPQAGFRGVYEQINNAKESINMEIYELDDEQAETALINASKRGVKVKVLLDKAYNGGKVNQASYSNLQKNGVDVKWAPEGTIYHIKTVTFDGKTANISTANLTEKYYANGRDAEIIDTNPAHVKAINDTFSNDWNAQKGVGQTVSAPGLIYSPGAADALTSVINNSKTSIKFTSEELADSRIVNALANTAKRGVKCQIVMTDSKNWSQNFQTVTQAGCSVHVYPNSTKATYIHEKIVDSDDSTVIIGSQNASQTSLNRNRELSIKLNKEEAPEAVKGITDQFDQDYQKANPWKG